MHIYIHMHMLSVSFTQQMCIYFQCCCLIFKNTPSNQNYHFLESYWKRNQYIALKPISFYLGQIRISENCACCLHCFRGGKIALTEPFFSAINIYWESLKQAALGNLLPSYCGVLVEALSISFITVPLPVLLLLLRELLTADLEDWCSAQVG